MLREDNDITEQQGCYYLTLNVVDWIDIFIRPVYKQIIAESLNYFIEKKGLSLYAWCLMTNHLHLVGQAKQDYGLSLIAQDFKKFTSKIILQDIDVEPEIRKKWMMKKIGSEVWQPAINPLFIDLSKEDEVEEQIYHIHNNPVRDRIVTIAEDYLHSSAKDYAGGKGLVNVQPLNRKDEFILRHISSYRYLGY